MQRCLLLKNINTSIVRYEIVDRQEDIEMGASESVESTAKIIGNESQFDVFEVAMWVWLFGIIFISAYSVVSIVRFKRKLLYAKNIDRNIFEVENIGTPFVFGVFKPLIYLPTNLDDVEKTNIIKHEEIHIKRHDNIIKIFAFIVLAIHWFNPLVWVSFVFMNNDMELSCDERALKELGGDVKKSYATALLSLASEKNMSGSPIAFSEGNVKGRVKNVKLQEKTYGV